MSHPIQYQAPLLARIGALDGIDLRVVFERPSSATDNYDPGFGRTVDWDMPLREGYENVTLAETDMEAEIAAADVLWLHGWQTPVFRRALILAGRENVPVLMRGENCDIAMPDGSGPKGWLKRRYIRRIFRRCWGLLAIGTENKNYYLDRGILPERIFNMPYAIDNQAFADRAEAARPGRDQLKQSLGIAPGQKVVLFAGKFQRRKRADLLVQAVDHLSVDGDKPALVMVGGGEMEGELRRQAPAAIFTGFKNQSELPAFYDMADVFVLPSELEPWGLAVNEAMACGTAVVASSQVGCAIDLISPNCGAVFQSGDVGALTIAIKRCLDDSDAMGRAAAEAIRGWSFDEDISGLKVALSALGGDA